MMTLNTYVTEPTIYNSSKNQRQVWNFIFVSARPFLFCIGHFLISLNIFMGNFCLKGHQGQDQPGNRG